jgi:hypothetical protein
MSVIISFVPLSFKALSLFHFSLWFFSTLVLRYRPHSGQADCVTGLLPLQEKSEHRNDSGKSGALSYFIEGN